MDENSTLSPGVASAQHDLDVLPAILFGGGQELVPDALSTMLVLALQAVLLFGLCLVGSMANCLVFVVFYRRPALRSLSNRFVLSLVFANLLTSVVVVPVVLVQVLAQWESSWGWWRQSVCSLTTLVVIASVFSILLIAVDRYYAVTSPLHYSMTITRHRSKLMIMAVWVAAVLLALPPVFMTQPPPQGHHSPCQPTPAALQDDLLPHTQMLSYAVALTVVGFALPLVVLCWVYVRMYHAAHKNSERTRRHSLSTNPGEVVLDPGSVPGTPDPSYQHQVASALHHHHLHHHHHHLRSKKSSEASAAQRRRSSSNASFSALFFREEGRAVKTAVMVIASFLLCWTPYFVTILGESSVVALRMPSLCRFLALLSALSSAALSPFIYVYRNETASSEALKVLCWWRKRGPPPTPFPPGTPAKGSLGGGGTPAKTWLEQETISVHSLGGSLDLPEGKVVDGRAMAAAGAHHVVANGMVPVRPLRPESLPAGYQGVSFRLAMRPHRMMTCMRQNSDSSDNSERPLLSSAQKRGESLSSYQSSSVGSGSFDMEAPPSASGGPRRYPLLRASTLDCAAVHQSSLNSSLQAVSLDSLRSQSKVSLVLTTDRDCCSSATRAVLKRQDSGCSADSGDGSLAMGMDLVGVVVMEQSESRDQHRSSERDRSCPRQDSNFSDISQRTVDSGVVSDLMSSKRKQQHKLQRFRAVEDYEDILVEESPVDEEGGQRKSKWRTSSTKSAACKGAEGGKKRAHSRGTSADGANYHKRKATEITARFKSSFRAKFNRSSLKVAHT